MADNEDDLYTDDESEEQVEETETTETPPPSETVTMSKAELQAMIKETSSQAATEAVETVFEKAQAAQLQQQQEEEASLSFDPATIKSSAVAEAGTVARELSKAMKELRTGYPELNEADIEDIENQLTENPGTTVAYIKQGVHRVIADAKIGRRFKTGELKGVGKPPPMVTPTSSRSSKLPGGTAITAFTKGYGPISKAAAARLKEAGGI